MNGGIHFKLKYLTILGVPKEDDSARSCGCRRKGVWELDLPASAVGRNRLYLHWLPGGFAQACTLPWLP